MPEIERLVKAFKRAVEDSPYYGPSTMTAQLGITAELAAARPAWSAHSIWELVNHIAAELTYALAVLEKTAGPWVDGETTEISLLAGAYRRPA